jgi:DNA-binding transcriptional LysR family regulator
MDIADFRLKVFCSVAKNLSYTKAAQEMRISQPAVSKHIHELENQYGVRLIERMGSKIMLTKAGEVFLNHSISILENYSKLDFAMNMTRGKYSGELKIGASTTIAQYILPAILAKFISKFSLVKISLLNGNSNDVEEALLSHKIDLGLVEGDKRLNNLKYTHLVDDELVAITSTKSSYAKKDKMQIEELKNVPIVLRENGSGTLSVFLSALEKHGVKINDLNLVMQLGSSESIKMFLENSDTVSVVSFRCVSKELRQGIFKVIELPQIEMNRKLDFVQLQGEEENLSSVFMQFAIHEIKDI